MLIKRKGSANWQIKFSLGGKLINRSSGTSDKRLAERIEHEARKSIIEAKLSGSKEPYPWSKAVDLWCQEKASKRSLDTDLAIFKSLDPFFKDVDVSDMNSLAIAKYRSYIARRASESTANRHLSLIRSVMRRLQRLEIIDRVPAVELFSLEIKEPVWISPEQITKVLDALPSYARDIAEFAVLTGLRRGNVLGLKWAWVDL